MVFHVQSLWLIGTLNTLAFSVLVLLVRSTYPGHLRRALVLTALSNLGIALSFSLRIFYTQLPDFFSMVAANVLASFCLGMELFAIVALKRQDAPHAWIFGLPLLTLVSSLWFTYVQRNLTFSQLCFNTINLTLLIWIVWRISRPEHGRLPRADKLATVAFGLLGLSTLIVVLNFFASGSFPREYDLSQPRAVYNIVASCTAAALISSLFLLMVSERLSRELEIQALRDPLTEVYNRRAFEEIAFREMSGSVRSGLPFSLILCDIDHFKAINDTHGHLAGDAVLIAVTKALRASLRDEDFLFRWGGDEFFALLPRAGTVEAGVVARRIVEAFCSREFSIFGEPITVRLSVGLASNEGTLDDLSTLLRLADAAMYRSKQAAQKGFSFVADSNTGSIEYLAC
jgi:diguanylate cyclase (GGDEF)-like protein